MTVTEKEKDQLILDLSELFSDGLWKMDPQRARPLADRVHAMAKKLKPTLPPIAPGSQFFDDTTGNNEEVLFCLHFGITEFKRIALSSDQVSDGYRLRYVIAAVAIEEWRQLHRESMKAVDAINQWREWRDRNEN